MKVLGLCCGVGSLLREAQDAGFTVLGNVEPRTIYRTARWVWEANFPRLPLITFESNRDAVFRTWKDETDLVLGHPPCGSHSQLGRAASRDLPAAERHRREAVRRTRTGLLPFFTEYVRELRPRAFALDNLPKILKTVAPEEWWRAQLPGYRLTFVVMKNWDYGEPQVRERLWVIGVRKSLPAFVLKTPTKRLDGPATVAEALAGLSIVPWEDQPELGHVHFQPNEMPTGGYPTTDEPPRVVKTLSEQMHGWLGMPALIDWPYRTKTNRLTKKHGRRRLLWDWRSRAVTGLATVHHPLTGWPLTPRERARLMGWPDDFILTAPTWTRSTLMRLVLFTGKAVPSRFPRYLLPQLKNHLEA